MGDDLRQREGGGLDVIAALDDLQIRRNRSQVLVRVLVGQVSEAQRLADLAGGEEFLELSVVLATLKRAAAMRGKVVPWRGCPAPDRGCASRQ